jgi:hypothetical protein
MAGPMVLGGALPDGKDVGTPTPTAVAPQNPTRPSTSIGGAWSNWISKPENRAAMIQAGAMLLQPISPGQSVGGHIGRAVAGGAGAQARNVESRSKQELAMREMAVQESEANSRRISAESDRDGMSQYQRMRAYRQFVIDKAEGIANSQMLSDDPNAEFVTPEQVVQQLLEDPNTMREFEQFESQSGGAQVPTLRQATTPATNVPQVGEVRKGYRFKGGDPSAMESWEKVQ